MGARMGLLWIGVLFGLSLVACFGAKSPKWKLFNFLIIAAFITLGFCIGWAMGLWGRNMAIGGEVAVPLGMTLGVVGAIGCIRRNKMREKQSVSPAATS